MLKPLCYGRDYDLPITHFNSAVGPLQSTLGECCTAQADVGIRMKKQAATQRDSAAAVCLQGKCPKNVKENWSIVILM
jgi:hypothetical protein